MLAGQFLILEILKIKLIDLYKVSYIYFVLFKLFGSIKLYTDKFFQLNKHIFMRKFISRKEILLFKKKYF